MHLEGRHNQNSGVNQTRAVEPKAPSTFNLGWHAWICGTALHRAGVPTDTPVSTMLMAGWDHAVFAPGAADDRAGEIDIRTVEA
jgi:hypothetical protein